MNKEGKKFEGLEDLKEMRIPETDIHYYISVRRKLKELIEGPDITKRSIFFDWGIIIHKFLGWYYDEYDRKLVLQYYGYNKI